MTLNAIGMLKFERQRAQSDLAAIDAALAALNGGRGRKSAPKTPTKKVAKKRQHAISAQGIRRIKAAQKARWQAYHKQQAHLAKEK